MAYEYTISWETVIIMSIFWLVVVRIYLHFHKKITGGFISALLDGKYNSKFMKFGEQMIEQNPGLLWEVVKRVLMSEERPGEYRLNDQARLFFIQMINEGLAYMDHSMQGSYGKAVQDGIVPNLNELAEVSPSTLIKGRKVLGKWGPLAMKALKVIDDLSGIKDQFHKMKDVTPKGKQ